jgi:elongation factor Ts
MPADINAVKELRERTGLGMMECKKALEQTNGDIEKAFEIIRKRGIAIAEKHKEKKTLEGRIGSYIHTNGKIGVLVEIGCLSDFVAQNSEFTQLLKDICLQVAAMSPIAISREQVPAAVIEEEKKKYAADVQDKPADVAEKIITGKMEKFFYSQKCLLEQVFVKDPEGKQTIKELVQGKIAAFGENLDIRRFVRLQVGE